MKAAYAYVVNSTLLAGCLALFSLAYAGQPSQATADNIARKLNAVNVHYLQLESGDPFSYQRGDQRLIPAFFYQEAAEYFRDDLIAQSDITSANTTTAGLGDVYLQKDTSAGRFVLMANPEQLAQARRFNDAPDFDEVPVFAVKHRDSGEFLTMVFDGQTILPFFIESQRVARALTLMKAQGNNPDDWQIIALPLATVVNELYAGRLAVQKVRFIGPQ